MGYTALTAFMEGKRSSSKEIAAIAFDAINKAIADGNLLSLLEQDAEQIAALMDKADRVDDLERQVKNLEWNLGRLLYVGWTVDPSCGST